MLKRIIEILLLAVSVVVAVLYYAGGEMAGGAYVYTEHILTWAYILAGIAGAMALLFPLVQIIIHPKRGRGTIIGIVGLVVVVLIAYNLASTQPLNFTSPNPNNVPTVLKYTGTGLITMYLLVGVGLGAILFTEISKSFK